MEPTMVTTRIGSSKSSTRRKYLGEPEDPHFVPDSPIISRQSFTYEQEEELSRSCTRVLSSVPHSDDSEEDPLMKYITAQIALKPIKSNAQKEQPMFYKVPIGIGDESDSKPQKTKQVNPDTATPSEASKRNTIDRTNTSTPLTVLSETVCRPHSTRNDTTVRSDSRSSKVQAVRSLLDRTAPYDQQPRNVAATKSVTSLRGSRFESQQRATSVVTGKVGNISIAHVEVNKPLPSLARVDDRTPVEKQPSGFLRLLNTIKKQPVTTIVENDGSCSDSNTRKQKFSLASFFDRRKRQQPASSTV